MTTKILVVDCDPATQATVQTNIKRAGFEAVPALDAETATRCLDQAMPDLMLLEWNLPGITGLALLHRLRAGVRTRGLPVIMLTTRAELVDKIQGFSGGADDYVTKPFSPTELLARIKAVLRGSKPQLNSAVLVASDLRLDPASHSVEAGGRPLNLGPTEFRLLHFLMTHSERLHSRMQLLNHVWSDPPVVEERTVDVSIRRLRAALAGTGHDALIQTVRHGGYIFSVKGVSERVSRKTEMSARLGYTR